MSKLLDWIACIIVGAIAMFVTAFMYDMLKEIPLDVWVIVGKKLLWVLGFILGWWAIARATSIPDRARKAREGQQLTNSDHTTPNSTGMVE